MIIADRYIERFLNRDLQSYEWLKKATTKRLYRSLEKLALKPKWVLEPWRPQLVCFLIGVRRSTFLFFLDMGMGKTKVALDVISYRMRQGQIKRTLICVPNLVNIQQWELEIERHAPHLSYAGLEGNRLDRMAELQQLDRDVYVINYAGLQTLVSKMAQVKKKGRESRLHRKLNSKQALGFGQLFDCVVYDEIQSCKSHKSLTFKIARLFSFVIPYRYGLTGTPFGKDAQDLWAQFFIIDQGETLGRTLSMFRAAFFDQKKNFWGGFKYKLREDRKKDLRRIMHNRSISYRTTEGMPEVVYTKIEMDLPREALGYYEDLKDRLKSAIVIAARGASRVDEGYRVASNAFLRMRQVMSGFIAIYPEDGGERLKMRFSENPRLDALMELVNAMPPDRKMVVFHEYIASGDFIGEALKERGIKYARLGGAGSNKKDPGRELKRFNNDPACRIFIINPKAGGVGLNLQIANYMVFYERPTSPILHQQARARVIRRGQELTVFEYDLIMDDPMHIDEKLIALSKKGRKLLRELIIGNVALEGR